MNTDSERSPVYRHPYIPLTRLALGGGVVLSASVANPGCEAAPADIVARAGRASVRLTVDYANGSANINLTLDDAFQLAAELAWLLDEQDAYTADPDRRERLRAAYEGKAVTA